MNRRALICHAVLPLLLAAAAAAAAAEIPALPAAFADLRSRGYAVLPPGYAFAKDSDLELYNEAFAYISTPNQPLVRRSYGDRSHEVSFFRRQEADMSWLSPIAGRQLIEAVKRLERDLQTALPGEEFSLSEGRARLCAGQTGHEPPDDNVYMPHADRNVYFTANYAMRGPGTTIHRDVDGQIEESATPERRWVVISGSEREMAVDIPATMHAAPHGPAPGRILLQVRFGGKNIRFNMDKIAELDARWNRFLVHAFDRLPSPLREKLLKSYADYRP